MADKDTKIASTIKRDEDGTITLTITLPKADIAKEWEEAVTQAVKHATLPGFREGKAPRDLVEPKLDKEKLRDEVLKKLLPNAYIKAVEEHKIRPIINPKIHIEKIEDDTDWVFHALTCELPEVKLNDYKDQIKNLTAKSKIVVPGKEEQKPSFDQIVDIMLKSISVNIPAILTEGEIERQLSQLLGEIKKLGFSLDQYLASTNKTIDTLKEDYKAKAENDIKLEFALQKIAEEEKITVEQKELEEALQKAKDENERKQLEANLYLLANILKQQKTLDFLKNL
jgi:trigger factor